MSIDSAALDPATPIPARTRRHRFWLRFAFRVALAFGFCAGCVAWVLPDGQFAGNERMGGVGGALDEALRQGSAAPLTAYAQRVPGTRVCFVWEYNSLRYPPLWTYWRTYGLPNLQVPDSHWAIAVLRAGRAPDFALVRSQRVVLSQDGSGCADAERLRLDLEDRWAGRPFLLHASTVP